MCLVKFSNTFVLMYMQFSDVIITLHLDGLAIYHKTEIMLSAASQEHIIMVNLASSLENVGLASFRFDFPGNGYANIRI